VDGTRSSPSRPRCQGGAVSDLVNRQTVRRRSDLHQALRTTVFSPEDIGVVRAGPAERRRFLDETLAVIDPKAARAAEDLDRILRQRGALLRNSREEAQSRGGHHPGRVGSRLDAAGTALVEARETLVWSWRRSPRPLLAAGRTATDVGPWTTGGRGRAGWTPWLTRGETTSSGASTLVGPHRDELELSWEGLPSRTHASQGEQRSLALALQLAAHQLATERLGSAPVLLLDDVFSELDPNRSRALLAGLPPGQALLTTALPAPPEVVSGQGVHGWPPGGRVAPPGTPPLRPDERIPWHLTPTAMTAAHGRSTHRSTRCRPEAGDERLPGTGSPVRPLVGDRRTGGGGPREAGPARRGTPWW
jgi:hypothetical protein